MLKLKIPPLLYMFMMAVVMWLLDQYLPIYNLIASPWNMLGLVFITLAIVVDGVLLLQFFHINTSINPLHPDRVNSLVVTGLYRWSRNPMYLGFLLVLFGWATVLASVSPFIVLPLFMIILTVQQIIPEEIILEQKFGQEYRDYKSAVRRWI